MRKLFWIVVLIGGYFWVMTSGRDGFVLEQGKAIYNMIVHWFDGAEVDFNLNQEKTQSGSNKKRARRWD